MIAQVWDRKQNPHQPHPVSANVCEAQFRAAVADCIDIFGKHKKELRDRSSQFFNALLDLELCATADELIDEFPRAYRRLGAPGAFGYGTPCGDALRNLYDWWNAWGTARKGIEQVASSQA